MNNTDISCTITGGTYEGEEVLVCGGATLSVSGDTAKIKALHIDHREFSKIKRAKVMLSGGEYEEIALSNFGKMMILCLIKHRVMLLRIRWKKAMLFIQPVLRPI